MKVTKYFSSDAHETGKKQQADEFGQKAKDFKMVSLP